MPVIALVASGVAPVPLARTAGVPNTGPLLNEASASGLSGVGELLIRLPAAGGAGSRAVLGAGFAATPSCRPHWRPMSWVIA